MLLSLIIFRILIWVVLLNKILNIEYYKSLIEKFSFNDDFISSIVPYSNFIKINLSFIQNVMAGKTINSFIITLPRISDYDLYNLYTNIYLIIAQYQFNENYINPTLKVGDLLILKNDSKNRRYKIIKITENEFELLEQKKNLIKDLNGPIKRSILKKDILRNCVPIKRSVNKKNLNNYFNFFSKLNNLDAENDFIPTKFNRVSFIIGSKKIFDNFKNFIFNDSNLYNCIPCNYLSSTGNITYTLGIDPLIYFVPSYKIGYEYIIHQNLFVSNVFLFDDGFNELNQIINDQESRKFKLIGIKTSTLESKSNIIKYWQWHKEEISLINSL